MLSFFCSDFCSSITCSKLIFEANVISLYHYRSWMIFNDFQFIETSFVCYNCYRLLYKKFHIVGNLFIVKSLTYYKLTITNSIVPIFKISKVFDLIFLIFVPLSLVCTWPESVLPNLWEHIVNFCI